MRYLITLAFVFLLAACDSKIGASHPSSIEGTYTSLDGKTSYVFTPEGKVRVAHFGKSEEAAYVLEKSTIKFQFDGGMPRSFVVNADGSLTSDSATKYKKN